MIEPQYDCEDMDDIRTVTIPRTQYEALMAAAKSLHDMYYSGTNRNLWVAHNALAALRAAGCLEDGE